MESLANHCGWRGIKHFQLLLENFGCAYVKFCPTYPPTFTTAVRVHFPLWESISPLTNSPLSTFLTPLPCTGNKHSYLNFILLTESCARLCLDQNLTVKSNFSLQAISHRPVTDNFSITACPVLFFLYIQHVSDDSCY